MSYHWEIWIHKITEHRIRTLWSKSLTLIMWSMNFHKVFAAINTTLFREEYLRFCHIPSVDLVPCWIRYLHQAKKKLQSCVHIKWLCVYHSFLSNSLVAENANDNSIKCARHFLEWMLCSILQSLVKAARFQWS